VEYLPEELECDLNVRPEAGPDEADRLMGAAERVVAGVVDRHRGRLRGRGAGGGERGRDRGGNDDVAGAANHGFLR